MRVEAEQVVFRINGDRLEVDPKPVPIDKLKNGVLTERPLIPANFDSFIRLIKPVLHGEEE